MKGKHRNNSRKNRKLAMNTTKRKHRGAGPPTQHDADSALTRLSTTKAGIVSPILDDRTRTIKSKDVTSGRAVSFQMPRSKYSKMKTLFYQFLNQNIQDGILKPSNASCPEGFEIDHSMDHCLARLGLKADFCISQNQVRSVSVQVQPSTFNVPPSILDADHGVPRGEVTYNPKRIQDFIDNQQGNVFHFTNEEGDNGAILVEIRSGPFRAGPFFFDTRGCYKFQAFQPFALCPCEKASDGHIKGVNSEAFQYIPNVRIDDEYVLFPFHFLPYEDLRPEESGLKMPQFFLERTDITFSRMVSSLIVTDAKSKEGTSDISELPNCEDNTRGRLYLPRLKDPIINTKEIPIGDMEQSARERDYRKIYEYCAGFRRIRTVPAFWFDQKFRPEPLTEDEQSL